MSAAPGANPQRAAEYAIGRIFQIIRSSRPDPVARVWARCQASTRRDWLILARCRGVDAGRAWDELDEETRASLRRALAVMTDFFVDTGLAALRVPAADNRPTDRPRLGR